jgi:hypothetical protein
LKALLLQLVAVGDYMATTGGCIRLQTNWSQS